MVLVHGDLAFAVPCTFGLSFAALACWRDWWGWLRVAPQAFHSIHIVHIVTSVVQCYLYGVDDYHAKLRQRASHVATVFLVFFFAGFLVTQATVSLALRLRLARLAITPGLVLLQCVHVYARTGDEHVVVLLSFYGLGMYLLGAVVTFVTEWLLLRLWRKQERTIAELKEGYRHLSEAHEQNVKTAMDLAAHAIDANMRIAMMHPGDDDDEIDDE